MAYQNIEFAAGITKEGTDYTDKGRFTDGSLVRFRSNRAEKIGGWKTIGELITSGVSINKYFEGHSRALKNWIALDGSRFTAIGTELKIYVKSGKTFNDVTPIRKTTTGSATFSCTSGSSTITVTDNSHGASLNSFIIISSAATLGGSNVTATVLNQEYQITGVPTANTYTISARNADGTAVVADATVAGGGGGSTVVNYKINAGLDVFVPTIGWGAGVWNGNFSWNGNATLDSTNQLRVWTIDNFGEDLISCARGLGIFRWDTSAGVPTDGSNRMVDLSAVSGANLVPTVALGITVSEVDRHLIVLGCDPLNTGGTARTGTIDPMLIAFSDQENELEFESKLTNTAGSLRLSSGSTIIGSIKNRQETVIFTDTAVYSMQFIGPPLTFAVNLINEGSGLIAPKACVNGPTGIFFASKSGFFTYTGAVRSLPCTVQDFIFSDIDLGQAFKCFMGINSEFDEMWFFYPSLEDGTSEISRYAIFNYVDGSWSIGKLKRYAWQASGVEDKPIATFFSDDIQSGRLYEHENGFDDDNSSMTNVFLQSSSIDISSGNRFSFVKKLIPDVEFIKDTRISSNATMKIEVQTKSFPNTSRVTDSSNIVSVGETTGVLHVRARERAISLKFTSDDSSTNLGYKWQLGTTRLDLVPSGGR